MINIDVLDLSKIMTDEYSMKILAASNECPRSANQLSIKYEIPIAACYRKIRELEAFGLLECVDIISSQHGRRIKLYRSLIKDALLFYENGKLRVCLNFIENHKADFDETLDMLDII